MNARRKIETVLADIFGQYITNFKIVPGRAGEVIKDPIFVVAAEEVMEKERGSGVYLGDVKVVCVTDSNTSTTQAQDVLIGEALELIRQLSNTLCSGNTCIVDPDLKIQVDGIVQLSQSDALDTQSYGDMVALRVGFHETDRVLATAPAPNAPQVIAPWWTAAVQPQART